MFSILLQAPAAGSALPQLLFIGGIIIVFYFFMIRPQQKKQKDQKVFRESLKKGDKIVTIGGLHGKIIDMNSETITIEADKGVRLVFEKTAVSLEASKRIASTNPKKADAVELTIEEKI